MADVDIGEELLRAVRRDFRQELGDKDSKLAKILKRIQDGKGTFQDVALFSKECGAALSEAIAKNVTPDRLPNGQLYYNIANTVLRATLKDNYDLVNMVAQAAQEQTDSKLNIHLAPKQAPFPEDRIHKIINGAADQTADSDTIKRRLDAPVRNVTESFYDDFVEENAEFRDEAGLKTYLVRQTNGKCCDWCASLAGRYLYEDAPEEVFAKHDNCTCTVEYITDKYRENVHTKKRYALTPEQRQEILKNAPKPTRFTKEQAENLQINVMQNMKAQFPKGFRDTRNIGTQITSEELKEFTDKLSEYGIAFADVKGSKYGGFDTYCGDVQVLKDIAEHIKNNQEILTKISGNSKIIIGYDYLRDGGNVDVNTFAQTKGRVITFNKFMYDDSNFLKSEYQKAVETRQFAKGTTYLNVADHECGHILARTNPLYLSALRRICTEKADLEDIPLEQYIELNISIYAGYRDELPAEVNAMRYGANGDFACELFREANLI